MDTIRNEEEEFHAKLNFKVWLKIIHYTFSHPWILFLMIFFQVFSSIINVSFIPQLQASAINTLEAFPDFNIFTSNIMCNIFSLQFEVNYWIFIVLFLGLFLMNSLAVSVTCCFSGILQMYILCSMRRDAFHKIQELTFSYFDRTPTGWIIARIQSDTSRISDTLSWGAISLLWSFSDIIFSVFTMFFMSWQLSLIILCTLPVVIIISPYFQFTILKLNRKVRSSSSNFIAWLSECINGNKTIKTMAIEEVVEEEASNISAQIQTRAYKAKHFHSFFYPTINMISSITTAVILFIGGFLINRPEPLIAIGTLTLFLGFVRQIYNPIQDISENLGEIMATQASAEKIISLIETKVDFTDTKEVTDKYGDIFNPKKEQYEKINGKIEFKDLSFSYVEGTEVIHNMNLTINPGQKIAIVGETGSGKSTTVNLLCRFYEPTEGEILIDGTDYRKRSFSWLRSQIGFVQQSPFIFSGTVLDNIRYGKLNATDEECIQAAKEVDLDSFVLTLKDGYKTHLEDGGNDLSTGQKQLISFARAIVRDPAIMILDEATASIDTETEMVIQESINKILINRTSLVIAHRLSTIVDSDRILVMKDGLIVEDGSHQELMKLKGYYHHLYMNQFSEFKIDEQLNKGSTLI